MLDDAAEGERLRALHALGLLDTPREERFDRVVRLAQRLFDVPMAAVSLVDEKRQWHKSNVGLGDFREGPRADAFCSHAIQQREPLVVDDARADRRFRDNPYVTEDPRIRFYAGQPLAAPGGQVVATLCILDEQPRAMSETELALLRDLAAWIENELAVKEEMIRASEVQRALLPRAAPGVAGYEVAGRCFPVRDVGGDFFDYYLLGDDLQLCLADVMGKGVAAAIIAASVRAVLRGASQFNDATAAVNRSAAALDMDLTDTSTFVTLFSARLNTSTGRLEYVDAGHGLCAVLRADGSVQQLASDNLPLGVTADHRWLARRTVVGPGDTLVAVSDGLLDSFESTVAAARAVEWVVRQSHTAEEAVENVGRLRPQHGAVDDLTVLIVRRAG